MKVHLSVKTVAWVSSPADVGFLFPPTTALGRLSFIKMGTGQFSRNFLEGKKEKKKLVISSDNLAKGHDAWFTSAFLGIFI